MLGGLRFLLLVPGLVTMLIPFTQFLSLRMTVEGIAVTALTPRNPVNWYSGTQNLCLPIFPSFDPSNC